MRHALLAIVLFIAAGCASAPLDYSFHPRPHTVRVVNDFSYKVTLYWVVSQTRQAAAAAQVSPWDEKVVRVPGALQSQPRLGIIACNGRYTPTTRCALLIGEFVPSNGAIVTIMAGSHLAGSVN